MGPLALMRLFPPASQGRAMGVMSFSIAFTPAIAPALAGFLLDRFGWSSIFLLNLPFCAVAIVTAFYLLPLPGSRASKPFDWFGLGLLSLATMALVEAVTSLQHRGLLAPWTLCQFSVAIAAMLLYIRHAKHKPAPIIGLGLLRQRTFAMGSIVAFVYGFGVYASVYLIPVFLQNALAYSASSAGMALLPSGIALVFTLLVAGRLADHFPPKWLTAVGLAAFGLSFLLFAWWGGHISYAELIGVTIFGRIGLGLVMPALSLATMQHLQPHELSQSSVISSYARQLGGVMGVAIVAVFLEWRESVYGRMAPGIYTAYVQGFLLLSAVFLVAFLAAYRMETPARPGEPQKPVTH
jgi:predicted MFS family arabinose efflux permease